MDRNLIWRFFTDANGKWKWQQLAFDKSVIEESKTPYKEYEECLADARARGYIFRPALSTRPESTAPRTKRSYVRYG